MHFPRSLFTLFATLCLLLCVFSAPLDATGTTGVSPRRDTSGGLMKRQAVVQGTLCATVPIRVTVSFVQYTLINGICLCTEAGVLTTDSVTRLNAQIQAGGAVGGVIQTVAALVGGITNLLGLARTAGQGAVNAQPATCAYPAGSTPVCTGGNQLPGTTCNFACNSATPKLCGTSFCIAATASCVSGFPGRRSLQQLPLGDNAAILCPPGLEACYTSDMSMSLGKPVGWECVDTTSDIESCGGCEWPVAGGKQGEDCAALEGVSQVSCNKGQCEAVTCMRGFVLNGTECALKGLGSFWSAI